MLLPRAELQDISNIRVAAGSAFVLMNPTQFPPPGRAPLMLLDCLHIDLPALNGPTAPDLGFPEAWVSDERDERALPLLQCVLGTNRNSIEEMQRMHGTRRLLIS